MCTLSNACSAGNGDVFTPADWVVLPVSFSIFHQFEIYLTPNSVNASENFSFDYQSSEHVVSAYSIPNTMRFDSTIRLYITIRFNSNILFDSITEPSLPSTTDAISSQFIIN